MANPSLSTLIQELQDRIRQLEEGINQASPRADPVSSLALPSHADGHSQNKTAVTVADAKGKINAVSALEGALTGEPQREGYVGPSSAAAFMNLIRRAVDPSSPSSLQIPPNPSRPNTTTVSLTPPEALPPREIADDLISQYWDYPHPLNPYMNKARFDRIYRNLWTGQPIVNHPHPLMRITEQDSVAMVYLMFALGSQYYDWGESGIAQAHKFYSVARTLLDQRMLQVEDQSLQRVQVMLLMTQYLNSVSQWHKAWVVLGTAIRLCQHLGLHLPQTSSASNLRNPVDRELVRRVWHGCLVNERQMCMILGRLPMVSASAVPLPQEVDEDAFQSDTLPEGPLEHCTIEARRAGSATMISYFILSAELFDIVQDMLLAFCVDDGSNEETLSYDSFFVGPHSVFEIDSRLRKWTAKVPLALRIDQQSAPSSTEGKAISIFRRQAVILRLRYLQARIYQLRPVLAKVVTSHRLLHRQDGASSTIGPLMDDDLSYRTGLQCCLICVRASIELIGISKNHLTTAEAWGVKPVWLFGVLHIYLAATVLLAARLAPAITLGEVDDFTIDEAWQQGLSVLREFQYDNASAQRCVAALEILYKKHPDNKDNNNNNTQRSQPVEAVGHDGEQQQNYVAAPYTIGQVANGGGLDNEDPKQWFMDFDLSDPYDMSWFDVAPDLDPFTHQANFTTASANWWSTH
ncbi:hypothetical protein DV735_g4653, partial [Chaetothyriales sp. CBS 134920]